MKFSFYILVLFFFSLPWQDLVSLPGGGPLSVARLLGLALIAAVFAATLRRGIMRLRVPALTLILTGTFCLWAAVGSLGNLYSPTGAYLKAATYLQLAVMSVVIWQLCRTQKEHTTLLQAFVLGAYVVAGRIVYDYVTNPFEPNSMQSMARYTGLGDNPNGVATISALALPLAWFLASFRSRGVLRWLNYLYIPVAIFAIILTASRGGLVIAVAGLAVVPLTFRHLRRKSQVAVLMGTVIAAGILVTFAPESNFTRLAETSSELSEGNVSNRSQIWAAGLELYKQNPLLGSGTGTFVHAVEPFLGHKQLAHNVFLLNLVELGVFGFVLFTANLLVVLWPLLRLPGPENMFYLCLWFALVITLLPSNVEAAQFVWALLILMATRQAYTVKLPGLLSASAAPAAQQVLAPQNTRGGY